MGNASRTRSHVSSLWSSPLDMFRVLPITPLSPLSPPAGFKSAQQIPALTSGPTA